MPFLTEVEYQNTSPGSDKASTYTQEPTKMQSLPFHWLLGMSGSFMGSWRKLVLQEMSFAETLPRIDVCITNPPRMNDVIPFQSQVEQV